MSASLLHSLQQISQSADSIAQLPFPPPKIFTNALLQPHDITTLIRDTEPHERALFSVDPTINAAHTQPSRRRTVLPATDNNDTTTNATRASSSMASRIYAAQDSKYRQSAVARVLGGDMMSQIRRSTAGSQRPGGGGGGGGGVDVELLLKGAEMLCSVYPVAGAQERIDTLRMQYQQYAGVLQQLEYEVQCQAAELERMSYRGQQQQQQQQQYDEDEMDIDEPEEEEGGEKVTDADIQQEIEAIRGLEQRKRDLERRVDGLDQNIGQMMG